MQTGNFLTTSFCDPASEGKQIWNALHKLITNKNMIATGGTLFYFTHYFGSPAWLAEMRRVAERIELFVEDQAVLLTAVV